MRITGIQTREEFTQLLALSELKDLISLGLDAQNLDDDSILHLIRSAGKNLSGLSLAYNRITRRGVEALADAYRDGTLAALRFVNFRGNPGDPGDFIEEDQGVVISRTASKLAAELESDRGPLPWLHQPAPFAPAFAASRAD